MVEKSSSCLSSEETDGTGATLTTIPFPADDQTRARLCLEQARLHIEELDRELQRLARGGFRSPGEWARQTATPLVRIRCINSCLTSPAAVDSEAHTGEHWRWGDLENARHELQSVLLATATSVARLSDPVLGTADRRELLKELPLHRARQRRILAALRELHAIVTGEEGGHARPRKRR